MITNGIKKAENGDNKRKKAVWRMLKTCGKCDIKPLSKELERKYAMIKGVNRRIVEITSTEHDYFEKAVLYVKADKIGLPTEKITEEAREYLGRIVPVRKKGLPFVTKLVIGISAAVVLTIGACLLVLL